MPSFKVGDRVQMGRRAQPHWDGSVWTITDIRDGAADIRVGRTGVGPVAILGIGPIESAAYLHDLQHAKEPMHVRIKFKEQDLPIERVEYGGIVFDCLGDPDWGEYRLNCGGGTGTFSQEAAIEFLEAALKMVKQHG